MPFSCTLLKGPSYNRLPLGFTSGHLGLTNKAVISYLDDNTFHGVGGGDGRTGKKGNRSVGGQESVRLSVESRVVGLTNESSRLRLLREFINHGLRRTHANRNRHGRTGCVGLHHVGQTMNGESRPDKWNIFGQVMSIRRCWRKIIDRD